MEKNKELEQAASEYLVAFIKHLFNEGKSGFEIAEMLDIHEELIEKIISDGEMLKTIKERNKAFVENLKANHPDENEFKNKLFHHMIFLSDYDKNYYDYSSRYKNVGPWQRKFNFKNAIDFHFSHSKKYSDNDIDVLTRLSTGAVKTEISENFSDRDLSPDYKLRIINNLSDGLSIKEISEKYNCSEFAVKQTAAENNVALPVSDAGIKERLVQAIKEGYNFEQLAKRFRNTEQEINEQIKKHRIQPAINNTN